MGVNMDNKPTNILLVEDDYTTRRLVEKVLSRPNQDFKCALETASTLSSAIKQLHKQQFDNILLDLGLPDSSGIETVEKIHNSSPEVPIVVLTATDDKEMELESIGHGAQDYLVKGTDAWEKLVPRIRYTIENRRAVKGLVGSYRHFRWIVHDCPSAVVCISTQGQILDFNHKAERLWHCKKEDVISKNFFTLFVLDDDKENLRADIQRALSGEPFKNTKTSLTLADGTKYSLFWNLDRLGDGEEESTSVIAVAHAVAQKTPIKNDFFLIPGLAYNPNFEDTVNMVLNSLCEIMEKIDDATNLAEVVSMRRINKGLYETNYNHERIPHKNNAAIERLVLSLMGPEDLSS